MNKKKITTKDELNFNIAKEPKITIHELFWYFLFFSIIGLGIETLFCYFTTGVWESRKGLLYGPFCPVYGVGASLLILALSRFRKNGFKLFLYGAILGNVIEYLLSFFLEALYGTRFWDYTYLSYNLNGRICILYSIFWGILALFLIKLIKPWLDKVLLKIPSKVKIIIESILFGFLVLDAILTVWGVTSYNKRAINAYYQTTSSTNSSFIRHMETILFPNNYMQKTFPNLRFIDKEGKEIYIKTVLK